MVIVLNLRDNDYETLKENVKDFNLCAYDMNCESVTIPEFVYWLIRDSNANYLNKKENICEN